MDHRICLFIRIEMCMEMSVGGFFFWPSCKTLKGLVYLQGFWVGLVASVRTEGPFGRRTSGMPRPYQRAILPREVLVSIDLEACIKAKGPQDWRTRGTESLFGRGIFRHASDYLGGGGLHHPPSTLWTERIFRQPRVLIRLWICRSSNRPRVF